MHSNSTITGTDEDVLLLSDLLVFYWGKITHSCAASDEWLFPIKQVFGNAQFTAMIARWRGLLICI